MDLESVLGARKGEGVESACWVEACVTGTSNETQTNEIPDPDQVLEALQYLQARLGLTGKDLATVLKRFPEVLACRCFGKRV